MYQLKQRYGQTALITGASAGIGKAYAYALAKEGMNLILVARREALLNTLAQELQSQYSVAVQVIAQDLLEEHAVKNIVNQLKWPVDVLINNAGFGSYGDFQQLSIEREEQMVDMNCRVMVSLTHALIPEMLKNKRGAIVCLSSMVGHMPVPYMSTYSATKAFVRFFALSLAGELKPRGIDVLAVYPGDTVSEFREQAEFHKSLPGKQRKVEDVVHSTLKSLGKRVSIIDGGANKVIGFITRLWTEKRLVKAGARIWGP